MKSEVPKEGSSINRAHLPKSRLAEFIQVLVSCNDSATSELAKFFVDMKLHQKLTYFADIVQLLGMAVNDPGYFARQPLTKCPPNFIVVFPEDAPEWGENLLRKELVRIRKVIKEAHLHPGNPDLFCQTVMQDMDITHHVSESYRLAIGLVILELFTQINHELKEQFWTCGDNEFLDSSLNIIKKQRSDQIQRALDYIDKNYSWQFKEENSN